MKKIKHYFEDKVVCIAGAHCAVGKSLAIELNKLKAQVILLDYKKKPLKKIRKDFIREHIDWKIAKVDYRDKKRTKKVFKSIKKEFGKIDLLLNLTNISLSLQDQIDFKWSDQLNYDLEDSMNLIQLVLMKRYLKKRGQMVNFVRTSDMLSVPEDGTVKTMAAFSIVGLSHALREGLSQGKKKVNLVFMGEANRVIGTFYEEDTIYRDMDVPQNVSYILKGIADNEQFIFEANWSKAKWLAELLKPVINFRFWKKTKRRN